MPRVAPFAALVYDVAVAGPLERLTAPPYDVISEDRRADYLRREPRNIAHLDQPRSAHGDGEPERAYEDATELLATWRADGTLRLTAPSFFAYEMVFDLGGVVRRVRGVMAAMELEPWGGGVLPHEEVMPGQVRERLALLRATATHLSPIYGTIAGPCPPLARAIEDAVRVEPLLELRDDEGVRHRLWRLHGGLELGGALAGEPVLIADGHHRYTTALAFRDEMRATAGPGPWDRVLVFIVDASTEAVPVLPYHRVQLGGRPPSGGEAVDDLTAAIAAVDDASLRYATAVRDGSGIRYAVHHLAGEPPTVRELHRQHLDTEAPGDLLRFTHDAQAADADVRTDEALAAYFLPPTTPDHVLAIAARGERLPRKSTFFWPKPRTGVVLMPLDATDARTFATPTPPPPSS